jgi:23S rRNA (adenine2503-C2)-methyltransferase
MADSPQSELLGLSIQELTALVDEFGESPYRARQLFEALYRQRISELGEITTLPSGFRRQLAQKFTVGEPRVERRFFSTDGTIRYLVKLADGEQVETVWMPEGDGSEPAGLNESPLPTYALPPQRREAPASTRSPSDLPNSNRRRATICVSSQVGCAANCQFCLTALLGVTRNLRPGEIVGQIQMVLNEHRVDLGRERLNVVFMGMGEPFLNYRNFIRGACLLVQGTGIPESRMTVSTAGIVPGIRELGSEPIRPRLAISLNATNNALRDCLMPINRKWNLEALISTARDFPLRERERLTFEYVLLEGVNDSLESAEQLVNLLQGIRCKVNLIALNPGPGIPFRTPSPERAACFQSALVKAGVTTFIRIPRGRDIFAACGQLKRTSTLPDSPKSSATENIRITS